MLTVQTTIPQALLRLPFGIDAFMGDDEICLAVAVQISLNHGKVSIVPFPPDVMLQAAISSRTR